MWRRVVSHIHSIASRRSTVPLGIPAGGGQSLRIGAFASSRRTSFFSTYSGKASVTTNKRVDDIMPIATGLEREELQAEFEGRKRFDMDPPVGPFGTKNAPAVIRSYYDKRIVGCSGDEGEDEHDVVWFWLEKGKPHECHVCSQYFVLEVFGPGGPPDGHGDDDNHH